jgi:hypothetical protein
MKQGPFAPTGLCCPGHRHYYDPLRLPLGRPPLPVAGYRRTRFPIPAGPGPRRGSPVPRTTFRPFRAPYAGGFLGTRSRFPSAFRGLRPRGTGSAPPWPRLGGEYLFDAAGFASCCGPAGCPPPHGTLPRASHPGSHPSTAGALPQTLASLRTGLTPAGRPGLVARLPPSPPFRAQGPSYWTHTTFGTRSTAPKGVCACRGCAQPVEAGPARRWPAPREDEGGTTARTSSGWPRNER